MSGSPVLEIKNLSFSYGLKPIFKDVSISLNSGDFIHLKGENGVGKSTLLKCIAGLISPLSGSIEFHSNKESSNEDFDTRSCFSFLDAEHNGLFVDRSLLWNLQFYKDLHRSSQKPNSKTPSELAFKWGLNPNLLKNIFVSKFSTGMKRRLALACMEIQQKKIWILDEPYNGLDQKGASLLSDSFLSHLQNGGSIILSSHMDEAFKTLQTKILELHKAHISVEKY